MSYDPKKQKLQNIESLDNPKIGDFWHEMFSPYFLVVDVKNDDITVLSCLGGPNSYTRKNELNAKVDHGSYYTFDVSKGMVVDKLWMEQAVKYTSLEGFVADVYNNEKTVKIAIEWRDWKQKEMRKQIENLEKKFNEFTGWSTLKDGVKE